MSGLQMSKEELAFVCQNLFGSDLVIWPDEPSSSRLTNKSPQPHSILQTLISVFPACIPAKYNKYGNDWQAGIKNSWFKKDLSLLRVYELIKSDKFKTRTEVLRSISNEDENKAFKQKNFSYACFSGTFSRRNAQSLDKHSHLICIDLDHLPNVQVARKKIIREADPDHFVMLFTSPNANGLKVIFYSETLDRDTQSDYYAGFANYLAELCHLPATCIDTSCQDVSRACFLPHDPNAFINHKFLQLC